MDLPAKHRLRTAVMKWAYDVTGGRQSESGDATRFRLPDTWTGPMPPAKEIYDAFHYLHGEGLLDVRSAAEMSMPLTFALTHPGVREIERALEAPETPTNHLAPITSIITIGSIHGGAQIQQSSPGAAQTGGSTVDQRDYVEMFLTAARQLVEHIDDSNERAQAKAQLEVMKRELSRSEPQFGLLRELANGVRADLTKIAGAAAAAGVTSLPWP